MFHHCVVQTLLCFHGSVGGLQVETHKLLSLDVKLILVTTEVNLDCSAKKVTRS